VFRSPLDWALISPSLLLRLGQVSLSNSFPLFLPLSQGGLRQLSAQSQHRLEKGSDVLATSAMVKQGGSNGDPSLKSGERWRDSALCVEPQDKTVVEAEQGREEASREREERQRGRERWLTR
jgi:hypothetical protein